MLDKIQDENFYTTFGWMKNKLGLKGNKRDIFAIIYGFTQDGETEFTGSTSYLADWLDISRQTVIKILQELVSDNLIIRKEEFINNVQFNRYKVNFKGIKEFNRGSKEILQGVKKIYSQSKETLHNNIEDNDSSNITDLYIVSDNILESEEEKKEAGAKTPQLFSKCRTQKNDLKSFISNDIFSKNKRSTDLQKVENISNHLKMKVMQLNESKEVKEALYIWLDVLKQNKKAISYEQLVIAVNELDRATNDDEIKVEAIKKATLRVYRSFEWTIDEAKKCLHKEITYLSNGSNTPTKSIEELTERNNKLIEEDFNEKEIPNVY